MMSGRYANFWAKGLGNVHCGRCMNAQTFSFSNTFLGTLTFSFQGGHIVCLVALAAMGEGRERYERAMQMLHDEGKWKWVENKRIKDYCKEEDDPDYQDGLQYVFQKSF